jgi:hypothetical protein
MLLICPLLASSVSGQAWEDSIPKLQMQEDFDLMRDLFEQIHPGLYWHQSEDDWNTACKEFGEILPDSQSYRDFFYQMSDFVQNIGCGHSGLSPSPELSFNPTLPLNIEIIGEKFYSDSGNVIPFGNEILEIDSVPVVEILEQLRKYVTVDGLNPSADIQLVEDYFKDLFAYRYPIDDSILVVHQQNPDSLADSSYVWTSYFSGLFDFSFLSEDLTEPKLYKYTFGDGKKIALLEIPDFEPPPPYKLQLSTWFKDLKRWKADALVIDLRNNLGGQHTKAQILAQWILDEPFEPFEKIEVKTESLPQKSKLAFPVLGFERLVKSQFEKAGENSYLKKKLDFRQPKKSRYKGPVYVLVSGRTFSSATIFCTLLEEQDRAVFIGEEPGGNYFKTSAGFQPLYTLPNSGFQIRIPTIAFVMRSQNQEIDPSHGIHPDFEVDIDVEDFRAGKDTALWTAFDLIRGKSAMSNFNISDVDLRPAP